MRRVPYSDSAAQEAVGHAQKKCKPSYRRTVLRLPHLDHASVQTTERYLGCKQNLSFPVNDLFHLGAGANRYEPNP